MVLGGGLPETRTDNVIFIIVTSIVAANNVSTHISTSITMITLF